MKSARVLVAVTGILALSVSACAGQGRSEKELGEGDPAPAFDLSSAEGGQVSLSSFQGKRSVLLYFSMGPG